MERRAIGEWKWAHPSRVKRGRGRGGRGQKQVKGEPNETEKRYRDHLALLLAARQIRSFEPFPPPIILSRKRKLHVDFRVTRLDGRIEYHDVKGTRYTPKKRDPRPYVEADSALKMEWAAQRCPNADFYYVYETSEGWQRKAVT